MFILNLFLYLFQGSSDSGKGCSEAASPPPTNLNIVPTDTGLRIYQFLIQQNLVGLLIGKHGSFVTQIKAKTGASVFVRRHPDSIKLKICAVEGLFLIFNTLKFKIY